ncbi:zinc finger protein 585A-like [Anabas testudineus]|uniref:zinc finger protein 585A-like n=1 Tax=Anabas testudineus TaxID=64144 RepID=UPI000E45C3EC|nr:zinc finger protein 585A-like [Anabas testudineus]XP_026214819.1 zinc finger protein 585A-like [Anabas testudineus]XP_026214820.1 zinc finger protein 585A-like [Anabas testudineus]XP_026214821.1 zinc finger protein 585A-like [Anabas testudineus]
MGDVTVELDEEVPKQDSSLEPLPEPLLIILSPPPPYLPLPGEPTMFWHKWLKAFEHYIEVLGQDKLVDSTKCALLQNCLGPEGQHIFTSLIHSETTYSAAISVLTGYFSSDYTSQMYRLKFHQRAQMPGETIDQFVSALEELLSPCNYGDLQEKLILDQLIAKTSCPQLRDRLLLEKEPLTLAAALVISREVESALNESEQFGFHEVSVDIGDDLDPPVQRKAKRGRPRRGEERAKTKPPLTKTQSKPSNYKDNYYYSSDKLYYSDENDETDQAKTRNNVDNRASISPQRMKEESYNKSDDGGGDNDEDFISLAKQKGPCCPICIDRRFRNAHKLARHMRMHTKEKPFSCPICAMCFSQSYHMTRHLRNQHDAGQHVCPTCGISLESFTELKNHKKTHISQVQLGPDSIVTEENLDQPVPRKRGRPRRTEERTKTTSSLNKTPIKSSSHKDNYSQRSDELCCRDNVEDKSKNDDETKASNNGDDDDNEASSSSHRVEEEGSTKSSDSEDDDDDEDFVISLTKKKGSHCPLCNNRRFRNAHSLARHMRMHTKEKPFSCPTCAVTFSQSYHMVRHLRNQHGAGQHVCTTCGISLENVRELKNHKRMHMSQFLSCPNCEEKFIDDGAFLNHIMSHGKKQSTQRQQSDQVKNQDVGEVSRSNNNESDSCNDDAAEADAESGKRDKVDIKTEDKDSDEAKSQDGASRIDDSISKTKAKGHFCPICVNRCFRGANKLARHMRTHTKEKPFTCPVCALTFSQSYHMTRHLRNQHGLGQYICPKCGKNLSSWLELKAHKRTHAIEGLTCLACDKQFKDKATLVSHLKLHKKVQQSSPRSLICGDCGKVFGRMYHLKRHIMTHRKAMNGERYKCPDCQKNFAFPEDLNKHLEIHVKENNGTCPKCNATFNSPEELETHMGVHEKSYTCNTCGKKFKVEYALKKHEQGHLHEQYYCSLCCKRFIKLSHYKRHILVHNRRESKCPHCDSVFLQLTALKYHLRTHTEERPYQCSCCIETFEEKDALEQHCLKHRKFKKEKPYSCTRCDYAFATLGELTEHMTSHEGEQPSNCPICGKTFLNKNKLEKHLTIHTGERRHLCSICGNGFPSAASLKLHIHIHTGEKPFKCSQCSKSFRSNSGLRLHSRQHMEVRPSYKCPDCGRTYGRMTELKMHQRYHTGDKPYACTCCSKRFVSKDKLNVHMRIHTGERPYSCPHCGQTFTQTGDRNRHINKCH